MSNVLPGTIVVLLFAGIIYYLYHSIKTKGTACTSCTSCPILEKCDKDKKKQEMIDYYQDQTK